MGVTSSGIVFDDNAKFQYFDFEFYEESVRPDWEQVIKDSMLEIAVSPWHSKDLKADGTPKKKHRHCVYRQAGGPVKLETALKRLQPLGIAANGFIEPCIHPKNYQRYLIHLDNPEKEQFEGGRNAISVYNNFPLDLSRELTKEQVREIRKRCFEVIREYTITEYCDLLDYCLWEIGDDEMFDYASNHTIMFKGYLDSKRNKGF